MPAYNFKKQFVDDVISGVKKQTIRADRRDGQRPVAGDTAYCYTGMKTKFCRSLGNYKIIAVAGVEIFQNKQGVNIKLFSDDREAQMFGEAREDFAKADGFNSWIEFVEYFKDDLPFKGILIKW